MVGDITVDAVHAAMQRPALSAAPTTPYVLLTLHRAELTAAPDRLVQALEALDKQPLKVLFPCHPRTRKVLRSVAYEPGGALELVEPVGHRQILELVRHARCLVTDSGGLQKEAYLLGTPCLTLRSETEWVETVATGWNRLVEPAQLIQALEEVRPPAERPDIFGDGRAAERMLALLAHDKDFPDRRT